MTVFRPRPAQEKILAYRHGRMGISAVPGSGKTWTLSRMAADIIQRGGLRGDQEILIVTLVNSAVDNFRNRIGSFVEASGLLPLIQYRVRTLHGLANDIVSERPDLAGVSDTAYILDERAGDQILVDITRIWLRNHPDWLDGFLSQSLESDQRAWVTKERLPGLVLSTAKAFIKRAKDMEQTPEELFELLGGYSEDLPLVHMGVEIYSEYQRALAYRGAVDFDDLIQMATRSLQMDKGLLERLRERWPYILEDEAQDSSRLQEKILRLLVGEEGNWVRVGDPNQAIFETFTTASPDFLKSFMREPGVQSAELPNSGRSTASIIRVANHLIDWVQNQHPVSELRNALAPPKIEVTPPGDPQPNPVDAPEKIFLSGKRYSAENELRAIISSIENWLPKNKDATVAVLVPTNTRGFKLAEKLNEKDIENVEVLRSSRETRETAGALGNVLRYLSDPKSSRRLAMLYRVYRRDDRDDEDKVDRINQIVKLLRTCRHPEDYLWPSATGNWLEMLEDVDDETFEELLAFREIVQRWQGATILPIDQLILTIAQDLFTEPADLALAHKLALVLKRAGATNMEWRLPELTQELAVVAKNERRFLGFASDDLGFDPEEHRGKVVITTMHKAKGLEWDRVYLSSVNNYDFPSAQEYDSYMSEKWFIRDRLDIQAEALYELEQLVEGRVESWKTSGVASHQARIEYAAERLRLFYVGITRARKELIVTWNTGRKGDMQQSIPFVALQAFWESNK